MAIFVERRFEMGDTDVVARFFPYRRRPRVANSNATTSWTGRIMRTEATPLAKMAFRRSC